MLPAMMPSTAAAATGGQERDPAARQDDGQADGDDDERPQPAHVVHLAGIDPAQAIGERDAAEQDEEHPPEQVAAMDSHGLVCRDVTGERRRLPSGDPAMMRLWTPPCHAPRASGDAAWAVTMDPPVWEDPP